MGVGDAKVIVVVVNMPVLGWWLLLSLAGRRHGWWGGGGGGGGLGHGRGHCIIDADGGVVVMVGCVVVTVVASLTPVVGWSSWSSMQVVVVALLTKVVVVGHMAVVDVGGGGRIVDAGGG